MDTEKNRNETGKQEMAEESGNGNDADQSAMERGSEILGKAEDAVCNAYDKTARTVSGTYEHVRNYSSRNQGKTIFVVLGIGVGLGFLLGANSRRLTTGRFARPVVNAVSDIALAFFD